MKLIPYYLIFFFCSKAFAQFAVIADQDGYVNIRNEAQIDSKISDTLHNGFVVYGFEPKNNWVAVDYTKNDIALQGYVYKDRIKYLSEFTKVSPNKPTATKVIFHKDSLSIYIESKVFDSRKAKFTYLKENKDIIEKINGKKFWGTDGGMPKTVYKSIKITKGQKKIDLPVNTFDDLFEPNFFFSHIYYNEKDDVLYIMSSNSDGAGAYEVVWIIEKGKYRERKIACQF
ncbi:MAG: hypothetical protein EOO44_06465 [Flavobacterium sp.]|nr:MAG: hypothetical protein EOO44_06465 [Flavobacterium sp.]